MIVLPDAPSQVAGSLRRRAPPTQRLQRFPWRQLWLRMRAVV